MSKIIKTHHGKFHADELFAIATLLQCYPNSQVLRGPRNKEFFSGADFLVDIGREYKPSEGKFDHHQKESPLREEEVPFSSFGLVYNYFKQDDLAKIVDEQFIRFVDRNESPKAGEDRGRFGLSLINLVGNLNPNFVEEESLGRKVFDIQFNNALDFAQEALNRIEKHAAEKFIYCNTDLSKTIILDSLSVRYNAKDHPFFVQEQFEEKIRKHLVDNNSSDKQDKFQIQNFLSIYSPLPGENNTSIYQGGRYLSQFISRELRYLNALESVTEEILSEINSDTKYIINDKRRPYYEAIKRAPQIEYVIAREDDEGWVIISPSTENGRKNLFPESWRGASEEDLYKKTKIDILMCHRDGFIAKTKTKEDAIKVADLSLSL